MPRHAGVKQSSSFHSNCIALLKLSAAATSIFKNKALNLLLFKFSGDFVYVFCLLVWGGIGLLVGFFSFFFH